MAWLLPELELGAEPELKPLELDPLLVPLLVPVLELEPEFEDVPLLEEDPELVDEPVLADVEVVVLWVDPGSAKVTTPAATTLAMVTAVVVERTLFLPRSRSATRRRRSQWKRRRLCCSPSPRRCRAPSLRLPCRTCL